MTRKFSEYVSPGHPDKVADYISEYILDRYLEKDPNVRYAVEVMIKGNMVHLAGEVTSKVYFTCDEYRQFVQEALREIGYTEKYARDWNGNVINPYDTEEFVSRSKIFVKLKYPGSACALLMISSTPPDTDTPNPRTTTIAIVITIL